MPKDPAENQDQYKIGGGFLNEFEFQQNKGALTEEEHQRFLRQQEERQAGEAETAPRQPESEAERIAQMMEDARVKAEKNLRKKEKRERKHQSAQQRHGAERGKSRRLRSRPRGQHGREPAERRKLALLKGRGKKALSKAAAALLRRNKESGEETTAVKADEKGWHDKKAALKSSGKRRSARDEINGAR